MQQFFVEKLQSPWLSNDQRRQCLKVLRMRKGDSVRLVDGEGQGVLAKFIDDELLEMEVIEPIVWVHKKRSLTLIASMIRTERMEWMIQKACECGVDTIILYSSDNGVVRDFGKRNDRKLERLNLIAKEACEQSYRQHQVEVIGPVERHEIQGYTKDLNVYADIGETIHFVDAIKANTQSVCAVVGPEGGFSKKERSEFEKMGFEEVSLGDNVLRAETASLYICNMMSVCEVIR